MKKGRFIQHLLSGNPVTNEGGAESLPFLLSRNPRFRLVRFLLVFAFGFSSQVCANENEASRVPSPSQVVYNEVLAFCNDGEFDRARVSLSAAPPGTLSEPQIAEISGMVETYARNHDRAQRHFERWCELEPESQVARFNLGESLFLQQQFDRASLQFSAAGAVARANGDSDVVELSRYKQILCSLASSDEKSASELIDDFAWSDELPARRLVEAARHYRKGDWLKSRVLLSECADLFSPQVNDLYVDSLLELGWVRQRDGIPYFRSSP